MSMWTDDKELFGLMKEKLYTPVVGDILDTMGYNHQFLLNCGRSHPGPS